MGGELFTFNRFSPEKFLFDINFISAAFYFFLNFINEQFAGFNTHFPGILINNCQLRIKEVGNFIETVGKYANIFGYPQSGFLCSLYAPRATLSLTAKITCGK